MSWMQNLYETYEACLSEPDLVKNSQIPVTPLSHTCQNAHIHIVLDKNGGFRRAELMEKEQIILPATARSSAGRTNTNEAPHPLADKLQYCAGDYGRFGGTKKSGFVFYKRLLQNWCESPFSHPKACAVYAYIAKETVIADLVRVGLVHLDASGKLASTWTDEKTIPRIFSLLPKKAGKTEQGDALVCWSVEEPGVPQARTWEDETLYEAWQHYDADQMQVRDVCFLAGDIVPVAGLHPARLRHGGDNAKLISSNDKDGFTFRGRFDDKTGAQACTVGYVATQKAHSALRWLIARQGYRNGEQVVVSWAISGDPVPPVVAPTFDILEVPLVEVDHGADLGWTFASQLNSALRGYRRPPSSSRDVVIMALDAATKGRMAITFYRELDLTEFLDRIEAWHVDFAWPQWRKVKRLQSEGEARQKDFYREDIFAPSPSAITAALYGTRDSKEEARKATVERLLPCIADGRQIPRDMVELAVRRACNRSGFNDYEWQQILGVACALYKGYHARHHDPKQKRMYHMALDTECRDRGYLYGRLLAIADHIEERALYLADEKRPTNAARLMQRFADHPCSTWLNLRLSLEPYMNRLKSKRAVWLDKREADMESVHDLFLNDDFSSDARLSGDFLLGYYCQRSALRKSGSGTEKDNDSTNEGGEE